MPRKRPKPIEEQSLAERLIRAHGFGKAQRVLTYIACWSICCENLGRAPETVDEYSDWWRQSRATGFREQKLFRECMPGLETPTPIWESTRSTYSELFGNRNNGARLAVVLGLSL